MPAGGRHQLPAIFTPQSAPSSQTSRMYVSFTAHLIRCQCWEVLGYILLKRTTSVFQGRSVSHGQLGDSTISVLSHLPVWVQCVLNLRYEEQAQSEASVSCMCSPPSCHMQDRGETHTLSSHDLAEVRTPAPIITAWFITSLNLPELTKSTSHVSVTGSVAGRVCDSYSWDQVREQNIISFSGRQWTAILDWHNRVQIKWLFLCWRSHTPVFPTYWLRELTFISKAKQQNHPPGRTPTKYSFADSSALGKMNMHKVSIHN